MGCADVCLDHYCDSDGTFFNERLVVARIAHKCCECRIAIRKGDAYWLARGVHAGGPFWAAKTCPTCYEIREAFVCGSWEYGMLWESIRESMFPIWTERGPIDCLSKIDTRETRDVLRKNYAEWEARDALEKK